jgi:outer membrane protein TolC
MLLQDSLRYYDDNPDRNSDFQNSARLSYTIPFNSRARLSIRTDLENAELSYQQALNGFYQQREQVMYQVNARYWGLKLGEAQLQIRRDDLAQKRWTYEYYQIQNEYGFVPDLAVKQSRVSMNSAEAALLQVESSIRSFYEDFNLVLGLPLDYRVELTESLVAPTLERSPEDYVNLVLATNLQLKNMRLALNQTQNSLAVTKLGQQPDVGLTSSHQRDDGGDSFTNFQFQVSWPLGDGGATKARVRASESRIEQQLVDLWDTERSLKQQVQQLLRDIDTSQMQLKINDERVKLAAEALDTANFQFENGQFDFRDLQAAQLDLANSRLALEQTKYDLNVSIANLESMIHEY